MTIPTCVVEIKPLKQLNGQDVMDQRNIARIRARYELISSKRFDPVTFEEILQFRPEPRASMKYATMPVPSEIQSKPTEGFFEWFSRSPYNDMTGRATLMVNQALDPASYYKVTYWYYPWDGQWDYFQTRLESAVALNTYGGVGKPHHQSKYSIPVGTTGTVNLAPFRIS